MKKNCYTAPEAEWIEAGIVLDLLQASADANPLDGLDPEDYGDIW